MKLQELRAQYGQLSFQQAVQVLAQRLGLEIIGSGVMGTVLTRDDLPYVVKVVRAADRAYRWFYRYCEENRGDPNLPETRGLGVFLQNYFVVRIEKLEPLHAQWPGFEPLLSWLYREGFLEVDDDEDPADHVPPNWRELAHQFDVTQHGVLGTIMDCKRSGFRLDLHEGNFMLRGNTLVVIDPLFPA